MAKIPARRILVAMNMQRHLQHFRGTMLMAFTVLALSEVVQADNFANVYYSARKDQLVVTMAYRGTNPDHTFSSKWRQCKDLPDGHAHDSSDRAPGGVAGKAISRLSISLMRQQRRD